MMPASIDDVPGLLPGEGGDLAATVAPIFDFAPLDVDRDGDAVIVDCTWEQADSFRGLHPGGTWECGGDAKGRHDLRVTIPASALNVTGEPIPGVSCYVLVAVTTGPIRLVGEGY